MRYRLISMIFLLGAALVLVGCGEDVGLTDSGGKDQPPSDRPEWLIPVNEIFDGGPGKDGIPALTAPELRPAAEIAYLDDDDLIIGFRVGDEIRGYPHPILDWHEIINDGFGGASFAITYCPLTGSGIAWNRVLNGQATTFGVSGLLYNTNLIPYDRASGSNWSQMGLMAVNGPLQTSIPEILPIIETSWKTWKEIYPNSAVVTTETGFSRSYGRYPYQDYRTNSQLLFPISNNDSRRGMKDRVLGLLTDAGEKAYPLIDFPDGIETINDVVGGVPVVVAGSRGHNIAVVYQRQIGGTTLTFSPVQDALPAVMKDNEGTTWDVFGHAVSGPRSGQQLGATRSFIAYWFAWGTFYPDIEIYAR